MLKQVTCLQIGLLFALLNSEACTDLISPIKSRCHHRTPFYSCPFTVNPLPNNNFWTVPIGCVQAQGNATTTPPPPELFALSDKEKDAFPAWLIGVIVLSALVVIIAIATIVQRTLRRRANQRERYRMAS